MKERIVYTTRDRKTFLNEDELSGRRMYLKHIYQDSELLKKETYFKGELINLEIYTSDENLPDEEILFAYVNIPGVTVIRVSQSDGYRVFHSRKYSKFLPENEEVQVKDAEDRTVSLFYPDREDYHHQKTLYSGNGESLTFTYLSSGVPLVKRTKVLEMIGAFSQAHSLEIQPSFYLTFFPFLPSGLHYERESCKYFISSGFRTEMETDLREAFFERHFTKKVYTGDILKEIIIFENRKIARRKYFIRDGRAVDLSGLDYKVEIYFLEEEKNGFSQWKVAYYEGNVLRKRKVKVYDITGKTIFSQELDLLTGTLGSAVKYAYYHGPEACIWEGFQYDGSGKLMPVDILVNDGWEHIPYTIDEIAKEGFFQSDYGKYFAAASPEIPEIGNPVEKYTKIYRNHLGNQITEKEARLLFEYTEEVFDNHKLTKRTIFKTDSPQRRKADEYSRYTAVFYENRKSLESFGTIHDEVYYNQRQENGYIVYDLAVREDNYRGKIKATGMVVFDKYYRIVSKVVRDVLDQKFISACKVHEAYISPLLGTHSVKVNYNEYGEVAGYVDSTGYERSYTKAQFENDDFYDISPVNNEYYKSPDRLVPERPAFPFFDFRDAATRYVVYDRRESEIRLLFSGSKLRAAVDNRYSLIYFVEDERERDVFIRALPSAPDQVYFYNIRVSVQEIVAGYFGTRGIAARFIISLTSDTIQCEILNNHEHEDKLSFRLLESSDHTDCYCFFYEEKRIIGTEIFSEMIKELLLKT
ncbi:hypothetical protein [uncultured Chryseobacterium sp.]|uniref:hypothetical protein n=1 Tax=uncultured Chryseobacterium sp. TaxID=259322 RepID=UPI0025FC0651|nr:hypothetical protein [uncultured Chryseobacterium sp.]